MQTVQYVSHVFKIAVCDDSRVISMSVRVCVPHLFSRYTENITIKLETETRVT